MKISKLQKEVIHSNPSVRITVEITVEAEDLADFDYSGYDLIPDELIPDILVAVGKTYRIKKGKLNAKAQQGNKVRTRGKKTVRTIGIFGRKKELE